MGSKIRPPGTLSMGPFFFSKTWYFYGSIFQNFLKLKWRKFGTLIGQLFKIFRNLRQNGANFRKKFDIWYMDGSLFLQNGYMDGWHFKNPSGTPLPRPKLSTPPGCWSMSIIHTPPPQCMSGSHSDKCQLNFNIPTCWCGHTWHWCKHITLHRSFNGISHDLNFKSYNSPH